MSNKFSQKIAKHIQFSSQLEKITPISYRKETSNKENKNNHNCYDLKKNGEKSKSPTFTMKHSQSLVTWNY